MLRTPMGVQFSSFLMPRMPIGTLPTEASQRSKVHVWCATMNDEGYKLYCKVPLTVLPMVFDIYHGTINSSNFVFFVLYFY
jgi:hypothetical protein